MERGCGVRRRTSVPVLIFRAISRSYFVAGRAVCRGRGACGGSLFPQPATEPPHPPVWLPVSNARRGFLYRFPSISEISQRIQELSFSASSICAFFVPFSFLIRDQQVFQSETSRLSRETLRQIADTPNTLSNRPEKYHERSSLRHSEWSSTLKESWTLS